MLSTAPVPDLVVGFLIGGVVAKFLIRGVLLCCCCCCGGGGGGVIVF